MKLFSEYKGAFTEQYVAGELIAIGFTLYYYSKENSSLEMDFVLQNNDIYTIEVKAEENLRSKSLSTLRAKYEEIKAVRFSMMNYREQEWMTNVPLYAVSAWMKSVVKSSIRWNSFRRFHPALSTEAERMEWGSFVDFIIQMY